MVSEVERVTTKKPKVTNKQPSDTNPNQKKTKNQVPNFYLLNVLNFDMLHMLIFLMLFLTCMSSLLIEEDLSKIAKR
jgi:hypothetical protein